MKVLKFMAALVVGFSLVSSALADDRVSHFKGKESETLAEAIANFKDTNKKLEALLSGEVSNNDIAAVHEATYTLEKALEKINSELSTLAETLEEVHLASEKFDQQGVKTHGEEYIAVVKKLNKLGDSK